MSKGDRMRAGAIIVAAGRGERAGGQTPKQFQILAGRPVLFWSLNAFARDPRFERIVVVTQPDRIAEIAVWLPRALENRVEFAIGGATRTHSVRSGLQLLSEGAADKDRHGLDAVFIHDAARPGLTQDVLDRLFEALEDHDGAMPCLAVADALLRAPPANTDPTNVRETVNRNHLYRVQTPQAFHWEPLTRAYAAFGADEIAADDAHVVQQAGFSIGLACGSERLGKVTFPEDFAWMERMMGIRPATGFGFDVHEFEPGHHVILCGVELPYSASLRGHSDADAGFHALTDALLGAIAAGDIGDHFPPTDPKWRGARSEIFLAHARDLVTQKGGTISNVDLTFICEAPKIKPYREAMQAETARVLGIDASRVAIKATTTEGLGFAGRREGLAAQAIATVLLPSD